MGWGSRTDRGAVVHREDQENAPGPDSPLEVPKAGWKATAKRTVKEIKEDRVTLTAAGVAFYWFLSVFPMLIAAVGILALLHVGDSFVASVSSGIRETLPSGAASVLTDSLSSASAGTAGGLIAAVIAIAIALWSASSGMAAAEEAMDVAYDVPESRKFIKKRAMAIILTVAALVLGGLATGLLVFGQPLGLALSRAVSLGGAFSVVWTVIRWGLTVLAVMTLFAVFYYLGPNRQPPSWKWVSPGAVVAALIWLAASLGFSFYVSSFGGSYAKTYGSLAGVVILLLWLFLSALALLIGAELNGELEREKAARDRGEGTQGAGGTKQEETTGGVRPLRRA
jgi:membrane protein